MIKRVRNISNKGRDRPLRTVRLPTVVQTFLQGTKLAPPPVFVRMVWIIGGGNCVKIYLAGGLQTNISITTNANQARYKVWRCEKIERQSCGKNYRVFLSLKITKNFQYGPKMPEKDLTLCPDSYRGEFNESFHINLYQKLDGTKGIYNLPKTLDYTIIIQYLPYVL